MTLSVRSVGELARIQTVYLLLAFCQDHIPVLNYHSMKLRK